MGVGTEPVSLVVFPFKREDLGVVASNLATAAAHERVDEVWAVAASEGVVMDDVTAAADEVAAASGTPILVFPQDRIGVFRSGKGDGMNTAIARAACPRRDPNRQRGRHLPPGPGPAERAGWFAAR